MVAAAQDKKSDFRRTIDGGGVAFGVSRELQNKQRAAFIYLFIYYNTGVFFIFFFLEGAKCKEIINFFKSIEAALPLASCGHEHELDFG